MKKGALLKKGTEDDIQKDVVRPLTPLSEENKSSLSNILKLYAFSHPKIGYCQGMSFIAEFLLYLFRNEAVAFVFMDSLIEKYAMAQLYVDNIPLLKKLLYQMDRLVYLWLPSLMASLANEGFNSALFATPWFISVFTHILRSEDNEGLLAIWDCFLLYGWKAVFRAGIFSIQAVERSLTEAHTAELIQTLSKLAAFLHESSALHFKRAFKTIGVTNRMLQLLENEYNSIMLIGYR